MGRGGVREAGKGKKIGRPKAERLTDNKVATRVLAQAKVEQLWIKIIDFELAKIHGDPERASSNSLRETLKYLENRSLGNCVDTVNHLHDKPIEMNVKLSYFDAIERARKRATEKKA